MCPSVVGKIKMRKTDFICQVPFHFARMIKSMYTNRISQAKACSEGAGSHRTPKAARGAEAETRQEGSFLAWGLKND